MDTTKTLHSRLYAAIELDHIKECLNVIDLLCHQSCCTDEESLLSRYSHAHCSHCPLLHSIAKKNARVALYLLEQGCNPNIYECFPSDMKHNVSSCCKLLFKVIGKPSFEIVVMKILEATKELILDENANNILHIVCQKKLTSWLQIILTSPFQQHLLHCANKQGYLPMHVAAKNNFLDFFIIVFNNVVAIQCDCVLMNKRLSVSSTRDSSQNMGKKIKSDLTNRTGHKIGEAYGKDVHVKLRLCDKNDRRGRNRVNNSDTSLRTVSKPVGQSRIVSSHGRCVLDINSPIQWKGITVIHIAAQCKYQKLVKLLLDLGADVNGWHTQSYSPLFSCLISSKTETDASCDGCLFDVCRHLIAAGANVNEMCACQSFRSSAEDDAVTPLHLAAEIGCNRLIQLLLNNGADPKITSKNFAKLPVQMALEEGQTDSASILMNSHLYPDEFLANFSDKSSNTLPHSAGNCDMTIFSQLIDLGCSFNLPNINNAFPLDRAIFYGNVPYIHAILSHHPHVLNLWKQFNTCPPLHLAASSSLDPLPMCQILLSYGADIYAKAYGKNMAYRRALRSDCHKNVLYLCEMMSHPFTLSERKELLDHAENRMERDLAVRLKKRLENVPSLLMYSLDVVRQVYIRNELKFKLESLPIPRKMIRALKYQD